METKYSNEADVGALFRWIFKHGIRAACFISGFVLVAAGFDQRLGGSQAAGTIFGMRLLFSFVPAVAPVVAIGCIWAFPIAEELARQIRGELDQRHASGPSAKS